MYEVQPRQVNRREDNESGSICEAFQQRIRENILIRVGEISITIRNWMSILWTHRRLAPVLLCPALHCIVALK
jgi:hypothetical protein